MTETEFRLLQSGAGDPAFNLALDEVLLLGSRRTLRFYEWDPPGLSLGYFQQLEEGVLGEFRQQGMRVVRRPTGGGAIAHIHELTFSVTDDLGAGVFGPSVPEGYERIHRVFCRALGDLEVDATPREEHCLQSDLAEASWLCFYKSSPVDLAASGRKLLGSAERRLGNRVLHHGSLPLGANPVTGEATHCSAEAGRPVSFQEVAERVAVRFAEEYAVRLVPQDPDPQEIHQAHELARCKYERIDWTRRSRPG